MQTQWGTRAPIAVNLKQPNATVAALQLWKAALAATLCAAAFSQTGLAQVPPASILQIDVANNVLYLQDTSDVSKFATDPKATTVVGHGTTNFNLGVGIADIVAVNGQPVKGTHIRSAQNIFSSTAPAAGGAIADTVRVAQAMFTFEILKSDGTPIGTIVTNGYGGGPAPPGAPLTATGGNNFAITGGTGAFLGARGQMEVGGKPAGSGQPTGSLHNRGPREPPPQWRRNSAVCCSFDPDVRAANCDHSRRPGRDPFQRLLSCHFV